MIIKTVTSKLSKHVITLERVDLLSRTSFYCHPELDSGSRLSGVKRFVKESFMQSL